MKTVVIFTDGGCRGNGKSDAIGAYGAVLQLIENNNVVYEKEINKAFSNVTNNQMELMAVIEALNLLKYRCNVTIYSDSKYVCDAISKQWVAKWISNGWRTSGQTPVKNKELWIRLIGLLNKHEYQFVWVKGHADNRGNQRADELCNIAIDEYKNNL